MAELCNLVHRFASTTTAIAVTVRLFARSSAPQANTNALNPWYEQSAVVYYHWFRVGDASERAEHALSERQPALLQSSDRPRVGLYGAQKWPLTAQLVEKTAQGWSVYDRSRVFFDALSHGKGHIFAFGARCGACSARILGKFALNLHALCMRW